MIKQRKFIYGFMAVVLTLSLASCALMESMFDDKMVTTTGNVTPAGLERVIPADLGAVDIPEEVRKRLEESGQTLVIVDRDDVVDPAMAVDLTDPGEGWLEPAIGISLEVLGTLFPGVAVLEGLGLLFSRRKRKHYGAAVKAAAPVNGNMELKEAVVDLGRAIGVLHSSEASKEAFEEGLGEGEEEEDVL